MDKQGGLGRGVTFRPRPSCLGLGESWLGESWPGPVPWWRARRADVVEERRGTMWPWEVWRRHRESRRGPRDVPPVRRPGRARPTVQGVRGVITTPSSGASVCSDFSGHLQLSAMRDDRVDGKEVDRQQRQRPEGEDVGPCEVDEHADRQNDDAQRPGPRTTGKEAEPCRNGEAGSGAQDLSQPMGGRSLGSAAEPGFKVGDQSGSQHDEARLTHVEDSESYRGSSAEGAWTSCRCGLRHWFAAPRPLMGFGPHPA